MANKKWIDAGPVDNFKPDTVSEVLVGTKKVAVSNRGGKFGAVLGVCTHAGGPLGKGKLAEDYIVCPWHYWKFHRITGKAQPGYEDAVPQFETKVEGGRLWISDTPVTRGHKKVHPPHSLARPVDRAEGPIRLAGISTTAMDASEPRYSTSEALLETALEHAARELECETRLIKLNELQFRNCEGFYSKAARACTWPCSITQMDPKDELTEVYETFVHWADAVIVSTPIRWGQASALYYKMAERLNCVQNQVTINDRVLIQNKIASFIITGGQDNIQAVAGQLLTFFAELGFRFPQFPFIAHSRGWSAEDMEDNIRYVQDSEELRSGAKALAGRTVAMSKDLLQSKGACAGRTERGGRKAQPL